MTDWTDAYLNASAARRWTLSTFLGQFELGLRYEAIRRPIEKDLTLRVKAGEVAMVQSIGGRIAFVRTEDLTPADRVIHGHAPSGKLGVDRLEKLRGRRTRDEVRVGDAR